MKIKHIVYSAVLASLVFAGCQTASQKGAAPYKMTTVSEKNAVFEAKIAYPQFAGFDDLNSLIKSRTLGAYNDFKSSAQKTRRELESAKNASAEKIPPFEYAVTCDSIIVSDKYMSITEASGLSVKDIATQCKDYFMKRLSYGGNGTEAKKARTDWIAEGTIPEAGNYQTFTYDGKTLTVYFEPYTVAPYSEGVQKVTISAVR